METMTLQDAWGGTGCLHMGFLADDSGKVCCVPVGRASKSYYIVKGPWMLRFKGSTPQAKGTGLPLPLDGATVEPTGEKDFELRNENTEGDFFGKSALTRFKGFGDVTFEHAAVKRFTAKSRDSRDSWVEALQEQIDTIKALPRHWAPNLVMSKSKSFGTGEVSLTLQNLSSVLFSDYEDAQAASRLDETADVRV